VSSSAFERFGAAGVDTPSVVVDAAALDRNVAVMADHARAKGMALRPHAKTHKCPTVAQRQLAAGAVGLSVATFGEAEVFAAAGVEDLFVAYPLWPQPDTAGRLDALAGRCRLSVGADSAIAVAALAAMPGVAGRLGILVEVDCGLRRSGVAPSQAGELGRAVADSGLELRGVFTFPGHGYGPGRAPAAIDDEQRALGTAREAVVAAGLPCPVTSGGSTPTAAGTTGPVPSELRPGVYVFNDAQQVAMGVCAPDDVALAAVATVVSVPEPGRIVLDAGSKVLGPDRPAWMDGHGLLPDHRGAVVTGLWEHHAVVDTTSVDPGNRPKLGDRVVVVPNHVCIAVNLCPVLLVAEAGRVVTRWEVAARDRNR
jgi:D-serine deaminase-like pyridoxal phosphate-dependent protein